MFLRKCCKFQMEKKINKCYASFFINSTLLYDFYFFIFKISIK